MAVWWYGSVSSMRGSRVCVHALANFLLLSVTVTESWSPCSDSEVWKDPTRCRCVLSSITVNRISFGPHNPLSINEKRRLLLTTSWAPDVVWGIAVYNQQGNLLERVTIHPQSTYTCLSDRFTIPVDLIIRRAKTDPSSLGVLRLVFFAFHPLYNPVSDYLHCNTSLCQEVTALVHFAPSPGNIHLSVKPGNRVREGSKVTLTCHARDGYPPIESYFWLKRNSSHTGTGSHELQGRLVGAESLLEFGTVEIWHRGLYKCVAVNYPFGFRRKTISEGSIILEVT